MTTAQHWLSLPWRARRPLVAAATSTALILLFVLTPDAADVQAADVFASLRSPGQAAFVAGHRGGSSAAPENTLPAFQLAIDSDAEFVETDIQLTSDGVPVLMHDWTLDRTTNGSGPVWAMTAQQVAQLDAGSWFSAEYRGTTVPTLIEFLQLLKPSTKRAILELKGSFTAEQAATVAAQVYASGLQRRVLFASFDLMTLKALQSVATEVPRLIITHDVVGDPAILAGACGAVAIVTSRDFLESSPQSVEAIHAAGLGVLIYTLNSERTWSEAISLGVDGIITDSPSQLDRWLETG